ncbi:MAG: hypothetical protein ACREX3_06220 [Gammaproteobacteria bacterium]
MARWIRHCRARDLRLDDGKPLRQRVIGEMRRRRGPEQIGEIIAGEQAPGLERQADKQREMLARAEANLLASCGEEGRTAKTAQCERGRHSVPAFL